MNIFTTEFNGITHVVVVAHCSLHCAGSRMLKFPRSRQTHRRRGGPLTDLPLCRSNICHTGQSRRWSKTCWKGRMAEDWYWTLQSINLQDN